MSEVLSAQRCKFRVTSLNFLDIFSINYFHLKKTPFDLKSKSSKSSMPSSGSPSSWDLLFTPKAAAQHAAGIRERLERNRFLWPLLFGEKNQETKEKKTKKAKKHQETSRGYQNQQPRSYPKHPEAIWLIQYHWIPLVDLSTLPFAASAKLLALAIGMSTQMEPLELESKIPTG